MVYRVLENSVSHSSTVDVYMNGFAFETYRQVVGLALKLGVSAKDINGYIQKWAGDFALHAFLSGNKELFSDLVLFLRENQIPLKIKQKLLRLIMLIPGFYNLVKGAYIKLKHPGLS